MKYSLSEKTGMSIIYFILFLLMVITLYPFWHVMMYSLSNSQLAMEGGIFLYPRGFSLSAYKIVLSSTSLYVGFKNTLLRTAIGVVFNIVLTATLAYPLSLKFIRGRNVISVAVFFTMLFSGGLIPSYLLVRSIGIYDTFLAFILPGSISAYNMFIMKNYFQSIPESLYESAVLDGANPFRILFSIILPVSKPVIAAVALFYAMSHWNAFLDAIIYTKSQRLQVLQLYLRSTLNTSMLSALGDSSSFSKEIAQVTEESVKMTNVFITALPLLILYPYLQKYYIKGLLVGSIKG